ncbi:hypothetical protein ACIP98_05800 [Streptomyces sp. NPDC088354]|uniref:hypothetical protein n=1 Tax=Streptomyces sp. NPDC088354 TaxID=3365856 RepID=UPI003822AA05
MSAERTARRIEEILDGLAASGDGEAAAAAEELVRTLMEFYGAGLARAVELLEKRGTDPMAALLADEVVAGLLVLHDLHPEDTLTRAGRAVHAARAGTSVDIEHFDPDSGTLRLAAREGGGCGCPSTMDATRQRIEAALSCWAPEVTAVELPHAGPAAREPALLQIGTRPPGAP